MTFDDILDSASYSWEYRGGRCAVVEMGGGGIIPDYVCGYYERPEPIPYSRSEIEDSVDAHGGVTYVSDDLTFIGFDSAHSNSPTDVPRSWAVAQTEMMADSLMEVLGYD